MSLVLNAAQAMWASYLRARYQLVTETQEAVRHEVHEVESEPPASPV